MIPKLLRNKRFFGGKLFGVTLGLGRGGGPQTCKKRLAPSTVWVLSLEHCVYASPWGCLTNTQPPNSPPTGSNLDE
eukprot:5630930-Amphidinium_carterae.1